jgi:UDP-N-acetylglucosamine---dolichyl-phosphate N-acetylglucosaminyltransferase
VKVLGLIPAYDAQGMVGGVVEKALKYLPEVLVVDDGSSDNTAGEAGGAGARIISHPRNMGKGAALKTGFKYALEKEYDAVLTMDADGQHDPDEIPKLLSAASSDAGIVVGARLSERDKIPPARYRANMVGVKCISWRARNPLMDSQSGFRIYSAELLREMTVKSSGFEAESEMLMRAGIMGYRIISVPVRTIYSEEALKRSHFRTVPDTYHICIMFLKSFFW